MKAKLILALLLSLFVSLGSTAAEEKSWSVDTSVGFFSDYMFRGFNLYDGLSIQPTIGASYSFGDDLGSLGGTWWAHLPGEGDENGNSDDSEFDYTLSYDNSFGPFGVSTGFIWYTYPDSSVNATTEYYVSVAYDSVLNPTVSVYKDFDEFDSEYYELAFSETLEWSALGDGFNVTPFVVFAFASSAEKVYADDGFVHSTFGVSFDASLGDVTLSPTVNVTQAADDATEDEVWTGVTFGYSF
ncbi:MAG: hypothetical protein KDD64_00625 [Bdellovibrionales bacterium]|nr:hypothetical protein [Bdellovibrionales bacterium]